MPADQHAAESGMEHSGLGFASTAFLAGYQHLVVCGGTAAVDPQTFAGNVADGLGQRLRQPKGSAKGE